MDAAVQPRLGGIQRTYSHPLLDTPSPVHPGKLNPSGHDGAARRAGLHLRVQGGAHRDHGRGTAADPRPRLCRQVPRSWRADPPDRGGIRPRRAQCGRVRGGDGGGGAGGP